MALTLTASMRLYRMLIWLFPSELRGEFAEEMVLVFDEQLIAGVQRSSWRGLLTVWTRALVEVFTVAIPGHMASAAVAAAAITTSVALFYLFLGFFGPLPFPQR